MKRLWAVPMNNMYNGMTGVYYTLNNNKINKGESIISVIFITTPFTTP